MEDGIQLSVRVILRKKVLSSHPGLEHLKGLLYDYSVIILDSKEIA